MRITRLVILTLSAVLVGACGDEVAPTADPDRYVTSCDDYFENGETSDGLREAAEEADEPVRDFCEEVYEAVGAQAPLEQNPEVSPGSQPDESPKQDVPQGTPPGPGGVPQNYP